MSDIKLTPKQELFAQTYVKTGNASQAYRTAYNIKTMTDKSVNEKGSQMMATVKIKSRVKELQKEMENKHNISKERILKRLEEIIFEQDKLGVDKIELTAMNKAIDTLNKMLGYNEPEKQEITHSGVVTILPEKNEDN